ncbi:MAG: DUF3592 domain-containing protein [Planctomycetes bacterium]|nr:DUF3592 domain-containing protein [Planctomycetota bacterium]
MRILAGAAAALLAAGAVGCALARQWDAAGVLGAASLLLGWTTVDLLSRLRADDSGVTRSSLFGAVALRWEDVDPEACCLAPPLPLVLVSRQGRALCVPRGERDVEATVRERVRGGGAPRSLWPCVKVDPQFRVAALSLLLGTALIFVVRRRSVPEEDLGPNPLRVSGKILMAEEVSRDEHVVTYAYEGGGKTRIGQDRTAARLAGEAAVWYNPARPDRSRLESSLDAARDRRRAATAVLVGSGGVALLGVAIGGLRLLAYRRARRRNSLAFPKT